MSAAAGTAIGVVLHPRRETLPVTEAITSWAREAGREVLGLAGERARHPDGVQSVPPQEMGSRSWLVMGIGGDGTLLRALAVAAPYGVPVLGVNLGRLGFLAEIEPHEVEPTLRAAARGELEVEQRLVLALATPWAPGCPPRAYNDIVLARLAGAGQAALGLRVGDEVFARYSADALIVSTPTGSTAYNFSAGGPIVSPRLAGMLVTPVATHSIFNRALVVAPDESLRIEVLDGSSAVSLEVDGQVVAQLEPRASVDVAARSDGARVLRRPGSSFYRRARAKLGVVDPLELMGERAGRA
jgi:NAD+ kinase